MSDIEKVRDSEDMFTWKARALKAEAALQEILENAYNGNWTLPSSFANCARSALQDENAHE